MPTNSLQQLTQALRLPAAQLQPTVVAEQLKLYLLSIDKPDVQLNPEQIQHFWQRLPFWAFAWAGGRALADFIYQHPETVRGLRVLDFGCGSGLVGIAAAQMGAKEVWVADLDPHALQAAQLNAELNKVQLRVVEAKQWPEVDVLLASDVLYDISSSADLKTLLLRIPQWLLAEREQVKPDFVPLACVAQLTTSTLPVLDDFDQNLLIDIYARE